MKKPPLNAILKVEIFLPDGKVVILSRDSLVYVDEEGVLAENEEGDELTCYTGFPTKITYKNLPE